MMWCTTTTQDTLHRALVSGAVAAEDINHKTGHLASLFPHSFPHSLVTLLLTHLYMNEVYLLRIVMPLSRSMLLLSIARSTVRVVPH